MKYKIKVQVNYNGDDAMLYSMVQKYIDGFQGGGIKMKQIADYEVYDGKN